MVSVLRRMRDDVHLTDWIQSVVFHRADERFGPAALQEACDGLAATLGEVSMSQQALFRTMTELHFLARMVEHCVAHVASEYRPTRDVQVAQEALQRLGDHLTPVLPRVLSPFWTAQDACTVRQELERAVWELHYALLVLNWSTAGRITGAHRLRFGT